ncbi:hypothetical protein AAMO2058_001303100 [Amorphochlora amoebiformis]
MGSGVDASFLDVLLTTWSFLVETIDEEIQNHPAAQYVKQSAGIRPGALVVIGSLVIVMCSIALYGQEFVTELVCFVYPAVMTTLRMERSSMDVVFWMSYWLIYNFIDLLESIEQYHIYIEEKTPLYFWFKLAFLVWCFSPITKGASKIANLQVMEVVGDFFFKSKPTTPRGAARFDFNEPPVRDRPKGSGALAEAEVRNARNSRNNRHNEKPRKDSAKSDFKLSKESLDICSKLDKYTLILINKFPAKVIEANHNKKGGVHTDLSKASTTHGWKETKKGWVKKKAKVQAIIKIGKGDSFKFPILEDAHFGKTKFSERLIRKLIRFETLFPLQDTYIDVSPAAVDKLLVDLKLAPGMAMPRARHDFAEMESNSSMSRLFFYGPGAPFVKELASDDPNIHLGPFVVDFAEDAKRSVRLGFREYGARVHFSPKQELTAIYDYHERELVKPGDPHWEHAKCLVRNNFGMRMTFINHLIHTHLCCANTTVNAMINNLSPDNPIRRLLTVFTFRTSYINSAAAESLTPELSMSHRCSALTYASLVGAMQEGIQDCQIFRPFPQWVEGKELIKMAKVGRFPFLEDGLNYYNTIRKFVQAWIQTSVDTNYLDDRNLAQLRDFYYEIKTKCLDFSYQPPHFSLDAAQDLITQFIFNVTGYHELVGSLVDFACSLRHCSARCRPGATTNDLQSFLMCAAVAALTSIRTPPLMSDFPNFFAKDGAPEWEIKVWAAFQKDLGELVVLNKKKNASRPHPFRYFQPDQLECSVSI